jgi:hypothetical protein
MRFFTGEWTGKSEGQPGSGTYERTCQFVLNKKFIEVKNKSTWSPTKENSGLRSRFNLTLIPANCNFSV